MLRRLMWIVPIVASFAATAAAAQGSSLAIPLGSRVRLTYGADRSVWEGQYAGGQGDSILVYSPSARVQGVVLQSTIRRVQYRGLAAPGSHDRRADGAARVGALLGIAAGIVATSTDGKHDDSLAPLVWLGTGALGYGAGLVVGTAAGIAQGRETWVDAPWPGAVFSERVPNGIRSSGALAVGVRIVY